MANRLEESIVVLHVDDEPDFAEMAAQFLNHQSEQFVVKAATSAAKGRDLLQDNEFDCIVSDFDMPGQDGIGFLKTVREDYPDLPFILYTGKGSEEIACEAIRAGVTDYLQKESGTSQYEVLANRIKNVVEQYRSKEAVAETEARLRTIAENTNDTLWKFTADWNELLFINSAYKEIWGRSTDELQERPQSFLKGIHPDDRDHAKEAMAKLSSGESVDLEYRVNAEEDFGRWVWVLGEPVFDDEGKVSKVVGFARDITDRKAHEKELERLKDRFQAFTELTSDVITVIDQDGLIQYESPSVERVLGFEPDQLVGTSAFERVHPDDRERVLKTFETVVGSPKSAIDKVEYRYQHADGTWIWLETVGSNRTDHAIDGYVITSRDITDRKEREQELAQQRAELRIYERAVEGSTELLAGTDTNGNLLFANKRYRDFHGLAAVDTSEITLREILGDTWKSEVEPRFERALAGDIVEYEMERSGPNDESRTLDIRYYPLRDGDENITGAVASMRDITNNDEQNAESRGNSGK